MISTGSSHFTRLTISYHRKETKVEIQSFGGPILCSLALGTLKKKDDAAKESNDALLHFGIWVGAGMKFDTRTGYPKLSKESSVAIVKVLLPGINPGAKSKDYKTM